MSEEIKPRHIRELRNLPISEMTDEEILKCAVRRLETKAALLVYESENRLVFLGRYKKGGYHFLTLLKNAWEERYGKFKASEDSDQ
jgi:hypothetical protein